MTEETRPRLYYSIREVSEMLDVKPHVLRYWESQFPSLRPKKSRGGARMYRDKDLDTLRSIRELLYDRRYTIAGARRRLDAPATEEMVSEEGDVPQIELEFLHPTHRRALREIRRELLALRAWLEGTEKSGIRRPRRIVSREVSGDGEISVDGPSPAP